MSDHINSKAKTVQKHLFISTFVWIFIGILYNFNLFTIIFIELVFIFCYYAICLVQHIPNFVSNITLSNGQRVG